MLEDLIVAAVNDASRRVDEAMKSGLSSMLGGLNLPPGLI
jgi:DNA-binding protein YbaB